MAQGVWFLLKVNILKVSNLTGYLLLKEERKTLQANKIISKPNIATDDNDRKGFNFY